MLLPDMELVGHSSTTRDEERHAPIAGDRRVLVERGSDGLDEPGVRAIVVNYRDVTERRRAEQAEEALSRSREELESRNDDLHALSCRLVETQELERRRLARELHDEVGQILTGLKLSLEMARRPSATASESLSRSIELVNQLIARVRDLSLDLHPAMLDDLGLLPALVWHFGRYEAQTGPRVLFEHTGLDRVFPPLVATAAFRMVQEALANVARHAGVGDVNVRVWTVDALLCLQVEDRGVGFDPSALPRHSDVTGLNGMRERARLLGGSLTLESIPGHGTRLTVELPI